MMTTKPKPRIWLNGVELEGVRHVSVIEEQDGRMTAILHLDLRHYETVSHPSMVSRPQKRKHRT
jgi:hypothetical protein